MDVFNVRKFDPAPGGLLMLLGRALCLFAVVILVVFGAVALTAGLAHAQDVAIGANASRASAVVDFGPLANLVLSYIAPTLGTLLMGLAAFVLAAIKKKTGWQTDAAAGAILDQGLQKAIGYAVVQLQDHKIGGIPIDLKSEAVATAVRYAQGKLPGALAHFGVTQASLEEMVEARLEGLLIDPGVEMAGAIAGRVRSALPVNIAG